MSNPLDIRHYDLLDLRLAGVINQDQLEALLKLRKTIRPSWWRRLLRKG